VSRILEEAGCKLRDLWYGFGDADGFALIEAPDNQTAAALAIAITASDAFPVGPRIAAGNTTRRRRADVRGLRIPLPKAK
jgi:hypothetical protein